MHALAGIALLLAPALAPPSHAPAASLASTAHPFASTAHPFASTAHRFASTVAQPFASSDSVGRATRSADDERADGCGSLATAAPPGARARRIAAPGHARLERLVLSVHAAAREPRDPPPASPAIGPLVARAAASAPRSSCGERCRAFTRTPGGSANPRITSTASNNFLAASTSPGDSANPRVAGPASKNPTSASTSPGDSATPRITSTASPDAVDTVVLRARGLDAATLRAALTRRRPDLAVRDDAPADPARSAFIEVVATPPEVTLDVVLADGRAYHRTLRPGNAPGERAAARMIVQLLAAIAERRAEPERRDVPIPAWTRDTPDELHPTDAPPAVPEPGADPSPARVPGPPPAAEPEPAEPVRETTAAPRRAPDPSPAPPADPPPDLVRPPAARPRGPLELGLAGDFTTVLGPGPPRDVSALRGLGGALHLDLRLPRGLVIGLAARGLARGAGGFHLARLRGAATLGYLYRRHRFELLTAVGLSFETWRVRQAGDGVYYAEPGADTRPLLIGGLVRAAPGVRLTPGRRVALRLGAWLELASSVLPTGAAARLSATRHDGNPPLPLFALGGVELAVGVELAAWFTLRR